jgi:hypothetical protein
MALLWLNMPPSGSCLKMIVVNEHSFDSICHHPDPVSKWSWLWAFLWLNMPPSRSYLKMHIRMTVVYEHTADSICHHLDPVSRCPSRGLWYMSILLTQYVTIWIMSQDAHQDDCGIWALLWLNMPSSGSCLKMTIILIVVYEHSSDSLCQHPDPVWRWQSYWLWYMSIHLTHYANIRIMSQDVHQDDCGMSTPLTQDATIRILSQDDNHIDCDVSTAPPPQEVTIEIIATRFPFSYYI